MHNRFKKNPTLRYGMVGGGATSQIGDSHRVALQRDGYYDLLAGVFDINPQDGRKFGAELGLDPERVYTDYREMAAAESAREDGIQVVGVMTPNSTHYAIAKTFIEAGIHLILEKPITTNVEDALDLIQLARKHNVLCASMYGYSGYPMVRQARAMVENGELGDINVVQTEFAHGNCATAVEQQSEGAAWRNDPKISGQTFVLGDIGTHALHLATFITGLQLKEVSADRQSFVSGRVLEDNAHVLLRFEKAEKSSQSAAGYLWASGVASVIVMVWELEFLVRKAVLSGGRNIQTNFIFRLWDKHHAILELDSPELYPCAQRLLRVNPDSRKVTLKHSPMFMLISQKIYRPKWLDTMQIRSVKIFRNWKTVWLEYNFWKLAWNLQQITVVG